MGKRGFRLRRIALSAAAIVGLAADINCAVAQTPVSRIDDALQNITALVRDGQIGYATF